MVKILGTACVLALILLACSEPRSDTPQVEATADDTTESRSDDAQAEEEERFHADARALVISHVEPNKLSVGGQEFRVKRNPLGEGCFVYDPRTRFHGVERLLVWWSLKPARPTPSTVPPKSSRRAFSGRAKLVSMVHRRAT